MAPKNFPNRICQSVSVVVSSSGREPLSRSLVTVAAGTVAVISMAIPMKTIPNIACVSLLSRSLLSARSA